MGEVGLWGRYRGAIGGSDVAWWENRGVYWIGEMGERRGFCCDIGFECGIKLVVVIELRKWL